MKRKLTVALMVATLALATVGTALADQPPPGQRGGPNPDPPKCTPANTPGCS